MAWQLSDDVIDIASDSAQSGKTPGTDLRQGVQTLPVLYALRSAVPPAAQPDADQRLRWLLTEADLTEEALRFKLSMHRAALMTLAWARQAGIRQIYAAAEPGRAGAEKWLVRLGFRPEQDVFVWRA